MSATKLVDLHANFLRWLDAWHKSHDYEPDFRRLAKYLDLRVIEGRRSAYDPHSMTVTVQKGLHYFRERHEGMHEVTHHLFRLAEDGYFYQSILTLAPNTLKTRKGMEEGIVAVAAHQLLIPGEVLIRHLERCKDDSEAIVQLAKARRTSFGLAGRRVILTLSRPMRGIILDSRGRVTESFGNGVGVARYVPGVNFTIDQTHPLRQGLEPARAILFRAAIPFKTSRRYWPVHTEAWYDESRHQTIALFDGRKLQNQGMIPLDPNWFRRAD